MILDFFLYIFYRAWYLLVICRSFAAGGTCRRIPALKLPKGRAELSFFREILFAVLFAGHLLTHYFLDFLHISFLRH